MTFKSAAPRVGLLVFLSLLFGALLASPTLGAQPAASESGGGGIDPGTAAQILGGLLVPIVAGGVSFVAGKRSAKSKLETTYKAQQLDAIDEFIEACRAVRLRLQPFVSGAGPADGLAGLRDDLLKLQDRRIIDDEAFEQKAQEFYGRTLDVFQAVVAGTPTQPMAEGAMDTYDELSARAADLRKEMTPRSGKTRSPRADGVVASRKPSRRRESTGRDHGASSKETLP